MKTLIKAKFHLDSSLNYGFRAAAASVGLEQELSPAVQGASPLVLLP